MRIKGNYYISDNDEFRIDKKHPDILLATNEVLHHRNLQRIGSVLLDGKTFYQFTFAHDFCEEDNDCLCFAEAMAVEQRRHTAKSCVFQVKGSTRKFGYSDVQNIELAREHGSDDDTNPEIGEAYAIVRTRTDAEGNPLYYEDDRGNGEPPYHIAFVIAKDGDTNITLEADAGNITLERPVFDMYAPTRPFHSTYIDIYGPGSTIVLTKPGRRKPLQQSPTKTLLTPTKRSKTPHRSRSTLKK